jgi:polysaccharide export outer membrane protein
MWTIYFTSQAHVAHFTAAHNLNPSLGRDLAGRRAAAPSRMASLSLTVLLITSLLGGGCARNIVDARRLPIEYEAPYVENAQTIDLSQLSAPTISNDSIDRGDVLDVTVATSYSASADRHPATSPVRVGDDGFADVPLIGRLPLAGLNLSAAEQAIEAAGIERGVFRDPVVTVTMRRQRMSRVTVLGAVEKPGIYEIPHGSCALLNALVAAGGLSKEAGTEVELHRPIRAGATQQAAASGADSSIVQAQYAVEQAVPPAEPGTWRVDLNQAAMRQESYGLTDGDVVMVLKRDPHPIHVLGLVRESGEFELPVNREMRLLDALAKAKGVSSQVADKVHVIRQIPGHTEPLVINISLREAKTSGKGNIRLASGDVVSVEQTPATIMYDTLNNFVRVGISGGIPLF